MRGSGPELRDCGRALLFCGREPGVTWGCDKNFVRTGTGGRNYPFVAWYRGCAKSFYGSGHRRETKLFFAPQTGPRRNFWLSRKQGSAETISSGNQCRAVLCKRPTVVLMKRFLPGRPFCIRRYRRSTGIAETRSFSTTSITNRKSDEGIERDSGTREAGHGRDMGMGGTWGQVSRPTKYLQDWDGRGRLGDWKFYAPGVNHGFRRSSDLDKLDR